MCEAAKKYENKNKNRYGNIVACKCYTVAFSVTIDNSIQNDYQSGPQDQKSVIFSHSVISLNQLLQNSKNTANIFLTFGNHVKIFLSQYIMQNF